MKREAFCDKEIYVFIWVEINFMQAKQNQFFHTSNVIDFGINLIYRKSNRIISTKSQLNGYISTMSFPCFS